MAAVMTQKIKDVVVVYLLTGRLVADAAIEATGKELMALAPKCENQKLLVNFQNVLFMSSAMLGKLVSLGKVCKTEKIELKLCSIHPDIAKIFAITGLNKVFEIHADEPKAMAAFEKHGLFW